MLAYVSHGLMTVTPTATNGSVSRVATANPCTAAMAAIYPSATEMMRPPIRARLIKGAYASAAY